MSVNSDPAPRANVGAQLFRAARAFDARVVRELHGAGYPDIRAAHAAVFARIRPEGSRVVDIAARAGMTKQSMGELVDDLVAKGYLERVPDPSDGRARLVVLTERGRRHRETALAIMGGIERDYQARLGAELYAALRAALDELAAIEDRGD